MANILRKVVSGPKARHVDKELNVDLDLSYITDRLIIMGWPASSFEALYRNRRKDVRRFLDAKHGEKYRIYNLCPCGENSYESKEFYGAVSRYPFPDHHPPPLSLIPMFVSDVTAWLAADQENVAVIHCKAGKGRSGTMACCYMLSLPLLPKLNDRNVNLGEEGVPKATDTTATSRETSSGGVPLEGKEQQDAMLGNLLADHPDVRSAAGPYPSSRQMASAAMEAAGSNESAYSVEALTARLNAVFQLHTARRLKPTKQRKKSFHTVQDAKDSEKADMKTQRDAERTAHRSRSVSGILRKASQSFRSTSNPLLSQSLSPSEHRRASSSVSTPSRSPLPSIGSPVIVAHYDKAATLGVSPKGRSTSDLRTLNDQDSRAASASGVYDDAWLTPLQTPVKKKVEHSKVDATVSCLDRYVLAAAPPDTQRGGDTRALSSMSPLSLKPPALFIEHGSPSSAFRTRMLSSSPYPIGSSAQSSSLSLFASEAPSNAVTDDESSPGRDEAIGRHDEQPVKLAVSIPSQRRFVGYWARMLAGRDARCEPSFQAVEPVRRVRITHIRIDRQIPELPQREKPDDDLAPDQAQADMKRKAKEDKTAFSIQMCRYNPLMEYKLHQWETNARRRTRAFGFIDPSAPAPDLPAEDIDEHGTDFKGPRRRQMEKEAEKKRWQSVEAENVEGAYERKLSQHGNDCGVGCWGINVLAEQERIRHFDWSEPKPDGSLSTDAHDEMKLQHLAYVYETGQTYKQIRSTPQSTLRVEETVVPSAVMQHHFSIKKDLSNLRFEHKLTPPSWLTERLPIRRGGEEEQRDASGECEPHGPLPISDDSSPSGSIVLRSSQTDTDKIPHSTPPTSVESMTRGGDDEDNDDDRGVIVNADHALMVKILAGRTGTTHSLLPDMASCGYIWFVPSFESPSHNGTVTSRKGEYVRCTFSAKEIDFRKTKKMARLTGGEIVSVEIEWQWLDAVRTADDESVQELLL
jgi:phosphatidylinositol-3,4,5-trisphosphate 3-phosphatase/dual-specificity protein phosphatase PTEN